MMHSVLIKATYCLVTISVLVLSLTSCSHQYNSNELDLTFYQWNKWHDQEAEAEYYGDYMIPAMGWEAFHRGVGDLVRIPSAVQDTGGVTWYHCRFTLPENWEERPISLIFNGITPVADIYLNEIHVGSVPLTEDPYPIDVSDPVNYTLDNHLAIRVIWLTDSAGIKGWGVTGKVIVQSKPDPG